MLSVADRLAAEIPGEQSGVPAEQSRKASRTGGVFALANGVDTIQVLDQLGIEHGDKYAVCPGCGEDGALICNGGGIKCLHDRCSGAGPKGKPGYRTNVDLVATVKRLEPADAARLICEWHNVRVPEQARAARRGPRKSGGSPELAESDSPDTSPTGVVAPSHTPPRAERVMFRSLRDRLADVASIGPPFPLGIAPLDVHLRGGLRVGKIMVIGGAPGSGKTTLAAQMGRYLAQQGVAVAFVAMDEEPSGIDCRNMQSIGIPRERAEQLALQDIERADALLGTLPFEVIDDCTLEGAFESLATKYPDRPRCVIGDSIQRLRTRRTERIESIRERISDVTATAKRLARDPRTAAIVICTSELARGAYRSKKAEDQIDDLAAFKESGAVEYDMSVGLVLRTVPADASLIRVSMPKNRIGTRGPFALRLDFATATFAPEALPQDDGDAECRADFDKLCYRVLAAVKANPGASGRRIRTEVGAKRDSVYAALERLEAHGAVRDTGKRGRRAKWEPILRNVQGNE